MLADRFGYRQAHKHLMKGWFRKLWFKFYRRWAYRHPKSSSKEYCLRYWDNHSASDFIVSLRPPSPFRLHATMLFQRAQKLREAYTLRNRGPISHPESGISLSSDTPEKQILAQAQAEWCLSTLSREPLESSPLDFTSSPHYESELHVIRSGRPTNTREAHRAAAAAWQPDQNVVNEVLEGFTLAKKEMMILYGGDLPLSWNLNYEEHQRAFEKIKATVARNIFHKRQYPEKEVSVSPTYRATLEPICDFFQWTKALDVVKLLDNLHRHRYGLANDGSKSRDPVHQALWFSPTTIPFDESVITLFQNGNARFQFWEPHVADLIPIAVASQRRHSDWAEILGITSPVQSVLPALLSLTVNTILLTPDKCPHPSLAGITETGRGWK